MDNCNVIIRGESEIAGESEAVFAPPFPFAPGKGDGDRHSPRGKSRWAWVWGILGSALSVAGFIALTLFEQYNASLNELKHELNHFNEVSSEFVKKESFKRIVEKLTECTKELQASSVTRTRLEKELEAAQSERREVEHEIQKMRERLAAVEGRQSAPPVVLISTPDKK